MMFSFLVCFLVLAAEWWTDSYKKYYKKLYRCRQTFLKPVHMNKWIHEMTFVRFILLLPHPHVECKKRHMGKYQTFLLSMKWHIRTFLFYYVCKYMERCEAAKWTGSWFLKRVCLLLDIKMLCFNKQQRGLVCAPDQDITNEPLWEL